MRAFWRQRTNVWADAVMRTAFPGSSIDHLSGGISGEKRSVDYTLPDEVRLPRQRHVLRGAFEYDRVEVQ